jgi:hypothetical protein
MKKIIFIVLTVLIVIVLGIVIYLKVNIFPKKLVFNKTTLIKLPFNVVVEPNSQEIFTVIRKLDDKEIKMESFLDTEIGCATSPGIYDLNSLNIYPTVDELYTQGGYGPRPEELNACIKGGTIQFKVQTPYDPKNDIYYLVITQKGKVKLKIKMPPINGNVNQVEKKASIKITTPASAVNEIFDYHPAFLDLQKAILKIVSYADNFYSVTNLPVSSIDDLKKSNYQLSAKKLVEDTSKYTSTVELDFSKTQELDLNNFSSPLKINVQKIILQENPVVDSNLLGSNVCVFTDDNFIYCFSGKSNLIGDRKELNKNIEMLELLNSTNEN